GNELVERLLKLNRDATALKPNIILWSESAVPWTYSKDDDFLKEVFKITAASNAVHIMGINTAYQDNEVYNSVYCLLPDGNVAGRYDKQFLLSLIEKPVSGLLIPFFSSKGFYARNDTVHNAPLNTPYGKAGIMVCNESAVPEAASNEANKGAEFFMNLSNDGWFNNTYIVNAHYYYARLRGVETRKDVVVNCNNGISGLIQASGRIAEQQRDTEPFVKMVTVQPNNYSTPAASNPLIFIYCCMLYMLFLAALKIVQKFRSIK
ncbi:MAG: nitrilase-related carbon-nitrogen hydrolase, partial [Panacibacter sp.]